MKKIAQTLAFGFCFLAFAFNVSAKEDTTNVKRLEIKTSAQCTMCKDAIEKAMAYERGVKTFNLNVETKILTVTYNDKKTNADKIRTAVSKIGYDADDVPGNPKAYAKLPACCKKPVENIEKPSCCGGHH